MATMNTVIEYLDSVKPNAYSDEDKYRWLASLDGRISVEVLGAAQPQLYALPQDADRLLLVPPPWDELYALYLAAMVDFHNREFASYNNSALLFTERLEAFRKWHIRREAAGRAKNFRNVMG